MKERVSDHQFQQFIDITNTTTLVCFLTWFKRVVTWNLKAHTILWNASNCVVSLISCGCFTSPTLIFIYLFIYFLQWANLIGPSHTQKRKKRKKKKGWDRKGSPKEKIPWKDEILVPLAQSYRWEEEDFGQNIWD
jgi:hypothetical protein